MQLSEFFRGINYVTLKTTNGCNLSCSYCNVEALTPKTPKMSIELVKQVAKLLIENSQSPYVGLEFHGGEPLLLPDEFFEEATSFARELARKHRKIVEFPIVTNGTMLSEERLLKLTRLGLQWCMSCDGPPDINDLLRQSGHAVQRAIELFQKHHIYTGVITVMSRANFNRMREVMDWFREVGVFDFRVNYLQPQGRGLEEHLLTGEEMFEGMRQVLEHMAATDVAVHEADMATHVSRFVRGRDTNPMPSCWEFQCQAGRTYVALDLLGRIHACGTDVVNHVIGHVNQPLDEEHYRQKLGVLHEKGDWVIRCFDCNAKQICNHSCPTSDFNSELYREYECHYTKLLWDYLCAHPQKAHHVDHIIQSRNRPDPGAFVPLESLGTSFVSSS